MYPEPKKLREGRLVEGESTSQDDLECTLVDEQAADQGRTSQSEDNYPRVSPAEDPLIGKIIGGHYLIVSRIGAGGMSSVYEAKHLLLDKAVAVKLISADRGMDGKAHMRFQQEAKAACALNHPNIASVNEFGQNADGSPFLVMEYVQGKSLAQVIKEEGRLDYARSMSIMLQLCDALDHAHEKSVIHRDIKPANIILTRDSNGAEVVKIVDFGIAKILAQDGVNLTQTGEVFGTPSYMSPEQCAGKQIDRRTDIYALGCVFEEMLSGHPPFMAGSAIELLMMHIDKTPTVKHNSAVDGVILRALEKEPSDRFQSAKEMGIALAALGSDNPRTALTQVPSRRRNAAGILFGGIVSAILIGIVCYLIATAKDERHQLQYAFALFLYIATIVQILSNHYFKKR